MISIFAGVVLRGRPTVVMNAALQEDRRIAAKPRRNIAVLLKGKKPTVKPKIAGGMA